MDVHGARIRPVNGGDLEVIAAIFGHYVTSSVITFEETPPGVTHWRSRREELAERGLPFLVADINGTVAGYAYASPWRPKPAYRHTVEDSVYLDPRWIGRGLGRRLLQTLMDDSAQAGARQMIAVIADNGQAASTALHYACGFTETGRLTAVGYKHHRWVDTLLLQRALPTGRQRWPSAR